MKRNPVKLQLLCVQVISWNRLSCNIHVGLTKEEAQRMFLTENKHFHVNISNTDTSLRLVPAKRTQRGWSPMGDWLEEKYLTFVSLNLPFQPGKLSKENRLWKYYFCSVFHCMNVPHLRCCIKSTASSIVSHT